MLKNRYIEPMDIWFKSLSTWLKKNEKTALLSAIFLLFITLSAACLWKYAIFGYNGIDLAYFSQVFWNTVHGRFFVQSIHPHLSLGDHAEFAILPLSLLYAFVPGPRTLLVMQAFALAACAWPVWRIARFRFSERIAATIPLAGLMMAAAFLLNPSLQNIGLFEFHVLAFAIFPLLMAMLAYETGDKKWFVAWCVMALLVREDVALVVVMMGLLAWLEGKSKWWRLTPFLLGTAWFLAAMRLIAFFSPDGAYKYRIYYEWLGSNPTEMLKTLFLHPLLVIGHIVSFANFEMLLGFLFPFALFPIFKPRRLLLAVGPLLQIILGAPGGGELILETHYATLFIPALALTAIDGAAVAPDVFRKRVRLLSQISAEKASFGLLLLCAAYGAATLGPLPAAVHQALTDRLAYVRAQRDWSLLSRVPADASIAASYALLPALSSRQHLTSLHYVALGVTQFAEKPYVPPEDLRMVALDADDLLTYRTQFLKTAWAAPHYAGWRRRLESVMGTPIFSDGTVMLYDRSSAAPPVMLAPALIRIAGKKASPFADAVTDAHGTKVRFSIDLGTDALPDGSAIRYRALDARGREVIDDALPVDSPMPWTSRNGGTALQFSATIPAWAIWPLRPEATITTSDSTLMLNGVRTAVRNGQPAKSVRTFDFPTVDQQK